METLEVGSRVVINIGQCTKAGRGMTHGVGLYVNGRTATVTEHFGGDDSHCWVVKLDKPIFVDGKAYVHQYFEADELELVNGD